MKVVINRCFGGFGISDLAFEKLIEKGWRVTEFTDEIEYIDPSADIVDASKSKYFSHRDGKYRFTHARNLKELRQNADLIQVVEELGEKANFPYAELKIVDIPDDVEWDIDDYDGMETVEEAHRTWY